MRVIKIFLIVLLVSLLTALTQIGGLVYLLSFLLHKTIDRILGTKWVRITAKLSLFITLYLLTTLIIVPLIAKPFGRVPLPMLETNGLRPLTTWTCLLNRNYVRYELREISYRVARKISEKYPGTVVNYLDANFPFINEFPLPPHLSHSDGEKLDVAFFYKERESDKQTNNTPSFIGYGVYELPRSNEINKPEYCESRGYWQYSFLQYIVPQNRKAYFTFDEDRTMSLVSYFASEREVGKIFIEPHLKERLGLWDNKIRFHGCQAVRHDDHIHIQIR